MKHFFARSGGRNQIIPGFGLSMGMTLTMLSLLILIPLASVLAHSLQLTANDYAKLITNSASATPSSPAFPVLSWRLWSTASLASSWPGSWSATISLGNAS